MRVFVTGATGFIGSAVVPELLGAGHQVLGLTRSEAGAEALRSAGAEPFHGDLNDLDGLRRGAALSEGVIHLAFNHDFSRFAENCEQDRQAIEALGTALAGTDRPLIVSGGVGGLAPGRLVTEDMTYPSDSPFPRVSEQTALATIPQGVRAMVMRLSQIHDPVKQGLVTYLIAVAREKGVSAYLGDGSNRWAAAPVGDTARLYRLALEQGTAGERFHAVAEEGVPQREVAEAIGQGLQVPTVSFSPEEAAAHFGWMASFAGLDISASSAWTQERLGWHPVGPGLIADLMQMQYEV